jgi:hypothetical protein
VAGRPGAAGTTGAGGNSEGDLVLWYKFDDTAGGAVAVDWATATGTPNNGTLVAAGTGTGMFSPTAPGGNGAVNLNGTTSANGAYVTVPASLNALGATTEITIACWVNITTDRAWSRLFDFNNSNTTGYMFLTTYQSQNTPNSVRFAITTTNNAGEQKISSAARAVDRRVAPPGGRARRRRDLHGTLYIDAPSRAPTRDDGAAFQRRQHDQQLDRPLGVHGGSVLRRHDRRLPRLQARPDRDRDRDAVRDDPVRRAAGAP